MVVPVFRAAGSLCPFFAKSASRMAFLRANERIKRWRAGPHCAALAERVPNRELKIKEPTIHFHAHLSTQSPLPIPVLSHSSAKKASKRGGTWPKEMEVEGVQVWWDSGRAAPASGETHAQALIPLSHKGRGPRPRCAPFLWNSTVRPRPSADPGTALPIPTWPLPRERSHLRQLSNEKPPTGGLYTDTAAIFPRKYFRAGGGSKPKETSTSGAAGGLGQRGGANSALGRLILELQAPRRARRCLDYITPSGVEEKLTPRCGKDVSQGGHLGDQAFCQPDQNCFYY